MPQGRSWGRRGDAVVDEAAERPRGPVAAVNGVAGTVAREVPHATAALRPHCGRQRGRGAATVGEAASRSRGGTLQQQLCTRSWDGRGGLRRGRGRGAGCWLPRHVRPRGTSPCRCGRCRGTALQPLLGRRLGRGHGMVVGTLAAAPHSCSFLLLQLPLGRSCTSDAVAPVPLISPCCHSPRYCSCGCCYHSSCWRGFLLLQATDCCCLPAATGCLCRMRAANC